MASTGTTIQTEIDRITKLKDSICEEVNTYFGGGGSNLNGVELALSYHHMGYGNPKITNKGSDGYYIIIEFHKNKAEVFNSAVGGRSERYSRFLYINEINGISTYYAPTVRTMGNREFNYFIIDNCSEWFKSNRYGQMEINFVEPLMIDEYKNYDIRELIYASAGDVSDGSPSVINIDKDNKEMKIGIYIDETGWWGNDDSTDILDGDSSYESTVRFYKIFREENNI